jgi:hypothetical protein
MSKKNNVWVIHYNIIKIFFLNNNKIKIIIKIIIKIKIIKIKIIKIIIIKIIK